MLTGRFAALTTGILLALVAGLAWGLVFVFPLLLPDYPPLWLSLGRYLAFGLMALPMLWFDRAQLARLEPGDWIMALQLSAVGNLLYYLCLATAIQLAGAPLPSIMVGMLPVTIPVAANLLAQRSASRGAVDNCGPDSVRDQPVAWKRLLPPLLLCGVGIALVNHAELQTGGFAGGEASDHAGVDPNRLANQRAIGAALALAALACWTWYPIRNSEWLRQRARCSPRAWATAQGVATLPLALTGFLVVCAIPGAGGEGFQVPLGPRPVAFVAAMLTLGLVASWIGTLCWNAASQRLPSTLLGPLIVFETLAALGYAYALRGEWPAPESALGIAALVLGVLLALRSPP